MSRSADAQCVAFAGAVNGLGACSRMILFESSRRHPAPKMAIASNAALNADLNDMSNLLGERYEKLPTTLPCSCRISIADST
jgi:hypothetical protein